MKHPIRSAMASALLVGALSAQVAHAVSDPASAPPASSTTSATTPSSTAPSASAKDSAPKSTAAPKARQSVIHLDETVISGNEELPKVLYIVPWQDPSGMPNIEISPEFTESQVFRRLYPPAYRRELQYYDLLEANKTEE